MPSIIDKASVPVLKRILEQVTDQRNKYLDRLNSCFAENDDSPEIQESRVYDFIKILSDFEVQISLTQRFIALAEKE